MPIPTLDRHCPKIPFVSVILPIRSEASFIGKTLEAILNQDYSPDHMEILVADGNSTDATKSVVQAIADRSSIPITIIENPEGIVPTGFNRAVARSRGDVIVRVDGHTIISPDYVRQCVEALRRSGAANAGGRMDPIGTNLFGKAVALATTSPFGVGGSRFHYSRQEEWVDTVYMGAWPRGVFEVVGLFDTEQVRNQDDEFNYRLRSKGGRILLSPAITSVYYNRGSAKSLWRQYLQYGYWKVRVMQKHPGQVSPRHFVPAGFVVGLAALSGAAFVSGWAFVALFATLSIYGIASLLAASLVFNGDWRLLPLVVVAFAIIHAAYGCGFALGLVSFWNRWGHSHSSAPATR